MSKLTPTPLEKLIKVTYLEWEKIIETVRKHSFEESLYPSFKKVAELIETKKLSSIPNVVGTLLTTINDKLSQVKDKEKEILEELASELFIAQITILNTTEEGRLCWQKCVAVLKDTCEFKGYDFEALSRLLKIDYVKITSAFSQNKSTTLPYYEWLGKKNELSELLRDIKDKQWIRNINEFKKIFTPLTDINYTFSAPTENKEKLLILFTALKASNLIIPKRNKGHLYPLSRYGMDFGKKLFEKEPKRYIESIKRKKNEYPSILEEVRKLIRLNI